MQHPNARLTVRGRLELVLLVEAGGASFRQAAAAFRWAGEKEIEASFSRLAGARGRVAHRHRASGHFDFAAWHVQRAAAAGASAEEIARRLGGFSTDVIEATLEDGNTLRERSGYNLPDIGFWKDGQFVGPGPA